jgi:hypothetical protein
MKINKEDLINAIGRLPIGWSIEDTGEAFLLTTRESGNVGEETAGQSDVVMGRRILGMLRKSFPQEENKSSAEVVDEWVIVSIDKGTNSDEAIRKELRQKIRNSIIPGQFYSQSFDYPYSYLLVLVESPWKKGKYILGLMDEEQEDPWMRGKIFITIKNRKPLAIKYLDRVTDDYGVVYKGSPRMPELVNPSIRRRELLEKTIRQRIKKEVSRGFEGREKGNYSEISRLENRVRAEEFAKYKMKYLKDYRQLTDGWMTPDPGDMLRKME